MAVFARGRSPETAPPPLFDVVRRGFDRLQVAEKIAGLTEDLATERQRADYAEQELRRALNRIRSLEQTGGSSPGFGDRVEKLLTLAEQQSAEITDRAEHHAREIVERARMEAEAHCREVDQALVSRAADLDQGAARRSAMLQHREEEIAASQIAARRQIEEVRTNAERDAAALRERAQAEAAELHAQTQASIRAERDKTTRELAQLIDMQDGVRTEMDRINHLLGELRKILNEELTPSGGHAAPRQPTALPLGTFSTVAPRAGF